jgi:4-carboxymuconolactone decarboxylase
MSTTTLQNSHTVFTEHPMPQQYLTGKAWVKVLFKDNYTKNSIVKSISFEPGARNNWHTHIGLQMLIATEGIGFYQERGKPVQELTEGNVVTVLPGVEHWYGASPDSYFKHLAIVTEIEYGKMEWMDKVTEEEYRNFNKQF